MEIQTEEQTHSGIKKLGSGLVFSIVIISVLAGMAAGAFGAFMVMQTPGLKIASERQQQTSVAEDSAVIDVVKQASPAVVSIIISQDLNQFQRNDLFNSPFFFDPFFQFRTPTAPNNETTPKYQQIGAGSGFFISSDGLILTNKHVVSDTNAKYTVLTNDGKSYDAKVVATDPVNDIALVKIDISNAPVLKLADSSKIEIGQRVIAIGNSLGQYNNTVTTGIVSGIGRNITAGGSGNSEQLEGVIQTDAAINPGNSGGPLLNIFGQVIGVNTAIDQQGQLVGFAIPSNDAAKSANSYSQFGRIIKPFLGIRYILINEEIKDQNKLSSDYGAWVNGGTDSNGKFTPAVVSGSAADKAGIKDGDIIITADGQRIDQNHTLASAIKQHNPGDKLKLEIIRSGKTISIEATLGESK